MNKITETPRLILREFSVLDAEHFYNLNADPEVIRYTGDSSFSSVADAAEFLESYTDYQNNGFGRWAVITKASGKYVGWCGLKLNELNLVDLGFRFFRNEWGKGYATESAKACLAYGFNQLNLEEIIGRASIDNEASIRVLQKVQMEFWKNDRCEGIERSVYYRIDQDRYKAFQS